MVSLARGGKSWVYENIYPEGYVGVTVVVRRGEGLEKRWMGVSRVWPIRGHVRYVSC